MHILKRFDYFTKTKEEFDSSTGIGGLFSLIAFGVYYSLECSHYSKELSSFLKMEVVKEMGVDNDIFTRNESVNFDFVFYKIPCQLLSIYRFEHDGAFQAEVRPKMEKYFPKTDSLEEYIRDKHREHLPNFFEEIARAVQNEEGCKVSGEVQIYEVPGSFEFSVKEKGHFYRMLSYDLQEKITVAFVLNHLSFGNRSFHNKIYNTFGLSRIFSPFDGDDHSDVRHDQKLSYFVKLVPNEYFNNRKTKSQRAYQYSLNHNVKTIDMNEFPTFTLSYEFSPIVVNYFREKHSILRFIVDTLAIIGGVFAVIGMLNSFVLTRSKYLRRN